MHIYLRDLSGEDTVNSFSIVSSPRNQRIEAYWSKLRNDRIGWWRIFFKDMLDLNLIDPSDPIVIECLRFCFMGVIRAELKDILVEWNQHIISKSLGGGPSGRHDTMYFLPHLYGCNNNIQNVPGDEIDDFYPVVEDFPPDVSEEFKQFAEEVMHNHNRVMSTNVHGSFDLYVFLLNEVAMYS